MTAQDIMEQAAKVYMNDSAQNIWTNVVLLPYLTKANEDLQRELLVYEIQTLKEASAVIQVAIDATTVAQPIDFISPIDMRERVSASSDSWKDVDEVEYVDEDLSVNKSTTLDEWAWRDLTLYVNPPTTAREVKLHYTRLLTALTATGSTVEIDIAKGYLSARTAQLASTNGGNSPEKGAILQPEVDISLDRVLRHLSNIQQGITGARRKRFRGRRQVVI